MVEPHQLGRAQHAVVALAGAVVEGVFHVERRLAELALVGDEVGIAVETRPIGDVEGVQHAVGVAVLAFVGNAGAVEILARSGGQIARVETAVAVAVQRRILGDLALVEHAIAVAVVAADLAFVGHEVAVAVDAVARGDVRTVEDTVLVAVLAFVGDARAVGVLDGAVGDLALVEDAVLVAVERRGRRKAATQPLPGEGKRILDQAELDGAFGEVVQVDRRLVADDPATVEDLLAARVDRRREVAAGHRPVGADEERGAVGADVGVGDVDDAKDAQRRGGRRDRGQQLGVGGIAVAVGIAPDADGDVGVVGEEDEAHLQRLDQACPLFDPVVGEPHHVGAGAADPELRAAVVDPVDERLAELARGGNAVAVAVAEQAVGDVAGVGDAVGVAVLAGELAGVGDAVAVAVGGTRGDLAGVEHAVAVAVPFGAGLDLADVRHAVGVAVGIAGVGRAVAVAVAFDALEDVADVGNAVAVAVEAAGVVEQALHVEGGAGDAKLVEPAVQELVEAAARVGVGADHHRTVADESGTWSHRDGLEGAVDAESDRAREGIEGVGDELPGVGPEFEIGDRGPRSTASGAAVAEAQCKFTAGEVLGSAVDLVDRIGEAAGVQVRRELELPVARVEGLLLDQHLPRREAAAEARVETDPRLDGEGAVGEGQPAVGVLDDDGAVEELDGEGVDASGLRNDLDGDVGRRRGAAGDAVESERSGVDRDAAALLEPPVALRHRGGDLAVVGNAVAVAVGGTHGDHLRVDDAVEIAVRRGVRPAVSVGVGQRLERLVGDDLSWQLGGLPLETGDGPAAGLVVLHAEQQRHPGVALDGRRPGRRALRLPLVDDEVAADPEAHPVVGRGEEGDRPGHRRDHDARPTHREVAVGQVRIVEVLEVEVDGLVVAHEQAFGELPAAVDRQVVLADHTGRQVPLAGVGNGVAIRIEAELALVGHAVEIAVAAGAGGDVLVVGNPVAVAVPGPARPALSRREGAKAAHCDHRRKQQIESTRAATRRRRAEAIWHRRIPEETAWRVAGKVAPIRASSRNTPPVREGSEKVSGSSRIGLAPRLTS